MLELVERERVDVVLPQSSFDLPGLAAARERFPVPVLVSSPETIQRSNDKAETYALLQRIGVPTIEFRRVAGAREVEAAARELGYPDRPVCFKPVFSSGSRGFRILDPTVDRAHQLLHERPGSVAMRLEEAVELLPDEGGTELLVMELATGGERTIDGIADGERIVLGHPKTREAMRAGLAMYFVTLDDDGADGDRRPDRARARDRVVLQHPARRRARDRGEPADLDDRLPGGPEPPVARGQAGARRDLRRRARGRCGRASGPADGACATSTRSSGSTGGRWRCASPTAPSTPQASRGRTSRRCARAASTRGSSSSTATDSIPRRTSTSSATAGCSRQQATQWRAFAQLAPSTDVFHFYFGLTLLPKSLQFPLLRALRQEVRDALPRLGHPRQARPRSSPGRGAPAPRSSARTTRSAGCRTRTSSRPGIDLARDPAGAAVGRPRAPVVLHAPSSRARKGTEHEVVAACERLGRRPRASSKGSTTARRSSATAHADIVVDQLNAGWYGVFAIEAMALGKPVVAFLHERGGRSGRRRPSASRCRSSPRRRRRSSTRCAPLVESPGELPPQIGAASRAYVERVHDIDARRRPPARPLRCVCR